MDYNQNTNPTEQQQFLLPTMTMDTDFTAEELAEDMDGMQMNFPRVKIPSGGSLQFEIPTGDPDNPDYAKTLTGVILFNHPNNAYWPEGSEYDDNAAPLCSSTDGRLGVGTPGGSCAICTMNLFGSAAEGKGKACKNMRVLYFLRSGEFIPLQINLPPTSLKPFRQFISQTFSFRRRATYGSLVEIGLKKMNNGKDDYSVATFRLLSDLSGDELAQVRDYANSFKEQIRNILQQHTETSETPSADNAYGYAATDAAGTDAAPAAEAPGQPYYGQPIYGDYEALPA
ncbi:hypothetical protein [uncultured Acetatifactor sp.]|jgi:hypothetical protein|uniref:hypothetical protein n=1 Tax=uncultured Acetatifactor sp. TaxID=1671927 RepID=UPI002611E95D|nr:hypothetical protein [uncultured Acetatifactor sp.]